ncbi:bacteriocin-like protein [Chryseobacterium jejuense]|uniref:bacteriocin-like protein n=1 Tax=Chryseobacterium jejuense TaxID=445960 RepID=UPI001DAB4D25|nr:hypothetical protein [Chryseobacterium jejuense]
MNCGSRKAYRVGNKLKLNNMKNLKKLTKMSLKTINGGGDVLCPARPIRSCDLWCGLTPLQKMRCLLDVEEECMC